MTPSTAAQIVLTAFILWMLVLVVMAFWPAFRSWTRWLVLLPIVLFLRTNPFSSVIGAAVFVVGSWALAVIFALALPLVSSLARLGGILFLLLSVALLSVPSFLKGAAPGRRWVGVALAGLFGPWGHWYVEGGGRWVVGIWALACLTGFVTQLVRLHWPGATAVNLPLDGLPNLWLGWPGVLFRVLSAFLMWVRFATASNHQSVPLSTATMSVPRSNRKD
jgi:hypothetical protein